MISAAFVVVAIVAGALFLKTRPAAQKKGGGGAVVTRTAVVVAGDLQRTVRISGTIQAERFAAMMAPQLHGSHSGRGRDGGGSSPSMRVTTVAVTSMGSSGVSSSTNTTSASNIVSSISGAGAANAGGDAAATSGSGSSRGSRVSNNRSAVTSTARAGRGSGGGSSGGSTPIGDADLGSTSGSLMRGGGGGGSRGGSDFMLVLLNVAKPGSRVTKGEVVAEFDRQYQLLRLDDYKASLAQYDSNVRKLKADMVVAQQAHDQLILVAKSDLDKANLDLKTREVRSDIDSERLRLFAEEAQARHKQILSEVNDFNEGQRAQLKAVEIDREQSRIELQRATNNVNRMLLKAPIDGIIVMQSLFRGGDQAQIQQGDQVYPGMFFMSIVDPNSMVVNANVNQADSELLRLGQKARVRLDAYPDVELPATVIGIGAMTKPGGFRASYVREIPVRLKLDKMDSRVIPDLSASADIVISSEQNAVLAPREAVFQAAAGDRPFVFVKAGDGWTRREVDLGIENHIMVAVRSGLRKGDVLAVQRPQT